MTSQLAVESCFPGCLLEKDFQLISQTTLVPIPAVWNIPWTLRNTMQLAPSLALIAEGRASSPWERQTWLF